MTLHRVELLTGPVHWYRVAFFEGKYGTHWVLRGGHGLL